MEKNTEQQINEFHNTYLMLHHHHM